MVSEKVIVILIVAAIILSVVSIAVTVSSVNTKMVPKINLVEGKTYPDSGKAQVSLQILPPEQPVNTTP